MKTYRAFLKQKGEGCDYTIGCGMISLSISADSIEDAENKLIKTIEENYCHSETRLELAELCAIENIKNIDVDLIYYKRLEQLKKEQQESKELIERQQYEKLKNKYENK